MASILCTVHRAVEPRSSNSAYQQVPGTVPGTSVNYIYRQVYFRIIAGLVENGLFSPYPCTKIEQRLTSRSVENAKRDGVTVGTLS